MLGCSSVPSSLSAILLFFFFNDTATTEIYTLSLHDALPISGADFGQAIHVRFARAEIAAFDGVVEQPEHRVAVILVILGGVDPDRKSTRLNSSHLVISYAVFCLKKKKMRSGPALLDQCAARC